MIIKSLNVAKTAEEEMYLRGEAARREVTVTCLLRDIVNVILKDRLVLSILDDDGKSQRQIKQALRDAEIFRPRPVPQTRAPKVKLSAVERVNLRAGALLPGGEARSNVPHRSSVDGPTRLLPTKRDAYSDLRAAVENTQKQTPPDEASNLSLSHASAPEATERPAVSAATLQYLDTRMPE